MTDLFADSHVEYVHSEVESLRFDISVGRITVPFASDPVTSLHEVRELLSSSEDDVVVLRYPSERVTWSAALRSAGRDLIHADAMVHCEQGLVDSLPSLPMGWPREDLHLVSGQDVDSASLDALVPVIFDGYTNHYSSNPLFNPRDVVAGYQEWVLTSLRREHVVCIVDHAGDPLGFVTFSAEDGRGDLHLGGITPRLRRQGAYTALLAQAGRLAAAAGCSSAGGPTQVQNVATQRVLAAAGYQPRAATNTMHAVRPGLLSSRRA